MEILTKNGFRKFDGIVCNGEKEVGELKVGDDKIICTPDHRYMSDDIWLYAKDTPGYFVNGVELVYDCVNVQGGNHYLTENITSHNCVLLDEFAFVENAEEFYQSTYPTITSGKNTKVIITSTPNGMNLYYKMWTDAEAGKNNYKAVKIHWTDHPEKDQAWFDELCRNLPPKQIAQEILCVSGDTLITVRDKITGEVKSAPIREIFDLLSNKEQEKL